MFSVTVRGPTSEPDVRKRHILTSKVDPHDKRDIPYVCMYT